MVYLMKEQKVLNGTTEAETNLNIALKLQNLLEQSGCTVLLTRSDENAIYDLDKNTLREKKISELKFSAKEFSELIFMLETGEINRGVQKEILRAMFDSGISPREGIKTFLVSVSDSEIEAKVFELIESNQKLVVEYFEGSTKAVDFFMGQLMRHFGKSINPKACKTIIIASLDSKKDELFR